MKKFLSNILIAILFMTIVPTVGFASSNNEDIVQGLTYLNVSEDSLEGESVESELTIQNIVLNKALLRIQGEVKYNGETTPFNIAGNVKKSSLLTNGVTAKLEDQFSNFEVIHFALADIALNEEECSLINGKKSGKVISLYLLKKGTREFSVFEGQIDQLKGNKHLVEQILSNTNDFEKASSFSEYWGPSIFKPVDGGSSVVSVDIDKKTGKETNVPERTKNSGEVSILGSDEYFVGDGTTKDFEYWETYNQGIECTITYKIKGRVKTSLGTSYGGTSVTILRKNTTSNCPLYVKEDSPFGIGTYSDPVKITATTNGYDKFTDLTMDYYNANKKYSGDFNVSIGVGISAFGVSLGPSYSYNLEELFTITAESTPTKMLVGYETSTEFPTKIQGKYDSMLLPFKDSQFYVHGNMYDKTPDTKIRALDSYSYFNISADYDGDFTGFILASIPEDRYFDINTWKFGAN